MVQEKRIGHIYRAGDPESLVEAVAKSRIPDNDMRDRCRLLFESEYRADIVLEKYHQAIIKLATHKPSEQQLQLR